jgi:ribulose-5-phosphate 4-epimerase/fuculose-1-phosphate aldolase
VLRREAAAAATSATTQLILRNHGLLTVGATDADAFLAMWLQRLRDQIAAQSSGAS